VNLSSREPDYTLLVDPVDGSVNWKKGIIGTCVSIAALPGNWVGKEMTPEDVELALIGEVNSGYIWRAQKGRGTQLKRGFMAKEYERVRTSQVERLDEAMIGIDLDAATDNTIKGTDMKEKRKVKRFFPLIERDKYTRRNGAAALDLAYVSSGALDAYVDVRDISTPDNWMAAYLLITENGVFTDPHGNSLSNVESNKPYNYVASGNQKLHDQILKTLKL